MNGSPRKIFSLRLLAAALVTLALGGLAYAEPALKSFSEKEIAASSDRQIVVRHLKLAGSNEAIGRKLAEIAQSRHGAEPTGGAGELTKKRWNFYKSQFPTHYARAVGAADFFGAPADGPADTMSLPVNLDSSPACSVVYYPPAYTQAGHAMLSRNYDFSTATFAEFNGHRPAEGARSSTADPYIVEMYPDKGYPSLYLCAYDLLGGCLDGVNSEGLTVALLANGDPEEVDSMHPTGSWRPGLSEIEIPRFVLDRCKNVDEARELLAKVTFYYSFLPCHYIIGDLSGRSFIWEYSYDLQDRHVVDGRERPQVITNHPIYKYETDSKHGKDLGESWGRYRRLSSEVAKSPKARSIDDLKHANACVKATGPGSSRFKGLPPRFGRTLWHAIYDCDDQSLDIDFYLGEDAASATHEKRSGYMRFKLDGAATVAQHNAKG